MERDLGGGGGGGFRLHRSFGFRVGLRAGLYVDY